MAESAKQSGWNFSQSKELKGCELTENQYGMICWLGTTGHLNQAFSHFSVCKQGKLTETAFTTQAPFPCSEGRFDRSSADSGEARKELSGNPMLFEH